MEQRIEHTPYVQILDAPVPQKVEQLVDFFKDLDSHVPVQVIEVPKISQDITPQRSVDLVPQMAEQLVDVPTVLTPTRIAVQIAEEIVGIPVPPGRHDRLPGSLPGQGSRTRRTFFVHPSSFLAGACAQLVLLVTLLLALFPSLSSGPDARHLGQYGTDSQLRSGLVLLVTMHLALYSFLLSLAPDACHDGRYGPEGMLRVAVQKTADFPQLQFLAGRRYFLLRCGGRFQWSCCSADH